MRRLLFDGHDLLVVIELHDTVALRIVHVIAEHRGAALDVRSAFQLLAQAVAVEDVVAEHERA